MMLVTSVRIPPDLEAEQPELAHIQTDGTMRRLDDIMHRFKTVSDYPFLDVNRHSTGA
jgi:hypothetical protein